MAVYTDTATPDFFFKLILLDLNYFIGLACVATLFQFPSRWQYFLFTMYFVFET